MLGQKKEEKQRKIELFKNFTDIVLEMPVSEKNIE